MEREWEDVGIDAEHCDDAQAESPKTYKVAKIHMPERKN